jgi:hypothetical protein
MSLETPVQHANTLKAIADQLVAFCRRGAYTEAIQALYSPDIISVEVNGQGFNQPKVDQGFAALQAKGEAWEAQFEVHSSSVSEPLLSESEFAVVFTMDVTDRQSQQRMTVSEVAVYEVANGKIVKEQFVYGACPSGSGLTPLCLSNY